MAGWAALCGVHTQQSPPLGDEGAHVTQDGTSSPTLGGVLRQGRDQASPRPAHPHHQLTVGMPFPQGRPSHGRCSHREREAISSHSRETCCRSGHPSPRKNIPSHGVSPTQGGTTGGHGTWGASPHTSQSRPSLTQAEAISQGDVPSEWLLPHKGGSPHLTGVITSHNVSPHTGGISPHGGHHSSRGGSPHTMCPLTWGGTSLQRGQHSSRSGERSPLTHVPSHGTAS